MFSFIRRSLRNQLVFWFVVLTVLFGIPFVLGYVGMQRMRREVLPMFEGLVMQERNTEKSYSMMQQYYLTHDETQYDRVTKAIDSMQAESQQVYESMKKWLGSDADIVQIAQEGNQCLVETGESMRKALQLEKEQHERFTALLENVFAVIERHSETEMGTAWMNEFSKASKILLRSVVSGDVSDLDLSAELIDKARVLLPGDMQSLGAMLGQYAEQLRDLSEGYKRRSGLDDEVVEGVAAVRQHLDEVSENATRGAGAVMRLLAVSLLMSFFVLIAISVIIVMRIGQRVSSAMDLVVSQLRYIKDGDLITEVQFTERQRESVDETGKMVRLTQEVREKLRELISSVESSSSRVLGASKSVNVSSRQIAEGANSQASSSEEVSSAMEEMAANIDQNAENAQQSETVAMNVSTVLKDVLDRGHETEVAVTEIANKIAIVSEIADQTNILALNAAVEAARAGEHGRGFAVVAAEVRKLAERSGAAAEEVVGLVNQAVKVTEQANKSLSEIRPGVEKSVQLSQEVATSSMEQRNGAEQVNNALQLLNNVSQANASASDKLAQEADKLSGLSHELQEVISYFRVEQGQGGTAVVQRSKPSLSTESKDGKASGATPNVAAGSKSVPSVKAARPASSVGATDRKVPSVAAAAGSKAVKPASGGLKPTGSSALQAKLKAAVAKPKVEPKRTSVSTPSSAAMKPAPAAPTTTTTVPAPAASGSAEAKPAQSVTAGAEAPKPVTAQPKVEEAKPSKKGGVIIDMSMGGTASDSDYESF